ncbi:MAG: MoaD/ThiS family protein [Candidatus Omnitrophica bacterium]|nr:MoaD/ThiS family protein [Candidatus Omnitrophota bacterium]
MTKTIQIQYFAILREQRGVSAESFVTTATTARELYSQIQSQHRLSLPPDLVRVSINNEFKNWDTVLTSGDHIVFIPPVAGG